MNGNSYVKTLVWQHLEQVENQFSFLCGSYMVVCSCHWFCGVAQPKFLMSLVYIIALLTCPFALFQLSRKEVLRVFFLDAKTLDWSRLVFLLVSSSGLVVVSRPISVGVNNPSRVKKGEAKRSSKTVSFFSKL